MEAGKNRLPKKQIEKAGVKMKKIEWIIHYVCNSAVCAECGKVEYPYPEFICDAHTHGMEKYGHLNFQVVIDYGPEEIGRLLNTMGILVQSGKRFSDGSIVEGLYLDCNVTLKEMKYDNSTSVLRLIIPDKNNKMPPFADYPYCLQYYTLEELQNIKVNQKN